jgi:RNA polymerase sigma-B factor
LALNPARNESKERPSGDAPEIVAAFRRLPDPDAREQLTKEYLPFAEHLARRFAGRGEPLDDLVQVASVGLLHAIDRFDPDREVRFSTFAAATIVGELKRHFRDKGWSIRVPRDLQESAMRVNRAISELWQDLGRSPTATEVARRANLSQDEVLEAMEALGAYSTVSLDAPTGEEGAPVMGSIAAVSDDVLEVSEDWITILPALESLSGRERHILYLRFFRGLTQSEIAVEIGISQMHVSRLLSHSLQKVRTQIGNAGLD